MALITRKIPRSQLQSYFDAFTKRYLLAESTNVLNVEVLSSDLGDQRTVAGQHLTGIAYDQHTNAFELYVESGDHRVYRPAEIWVVEDSSGFVHTIKIVRPDGIDEVIGLKRLAVQRRDGVARRHKRTDRPRA
jgi:hypothetical protein